MKQLCVKLIIAALVIMVSCKKSDKSSNPSAPPSAKDVKADISTTLAGKDSLSSYASLFSNITLNDADVAQAVTVFAPVNKAFTALTATAPRAINLMATGTTNAIAVVNTTLPDSSDAKDYIVKGKIAVSALTNGAVFTALSGKQLSVTTTNGNIYINGVLVSGINISSDNNYALFTLSAFINDSKLIKISSLSDNMALPGWLLTINGQNFSTTAANNIVKVNGTQAIVHTATANQLVVTVPQNATSGNVTVTTGIKSASGKQRLNIMQATVSSISQIVALHTGPIQGIALDANDNLFFTDNYSPQNNGNLIPYVRRFDSGGSGTAYAYRPSFPNPNGDGTNIPAFGNSGLWAIAIDKQNNIYAASNGGTNSYSGIFKFNSSTPTVAELWAGGSLAGAPVVGDKHSIQIYTAAMKFDNAGNLLYGNNLNNDNAGLMKISASGIASTIANSVYFRSADPAVLKAPNICGLDIDNAGNIYLGDNANRRIWKVGASGGVKVLAGNNNTIAKDGIGANAQFGSPFGIVLDKRGDVYVCDNDYNNNSFLIRIINPQGVVTTIAGKANSSSSTDGIGTNASFNGMNSIAIDSKGVLYVGSDGGGVRKITFEVPAGQ